MYHADCSARCLLVRITFLISISIYDAHRLFLCCHPANLVLLKFQSEMTPGTLQKVLIRHDPNKDLLIDVHMGVLSFEERSFYQLLALTLCTYVQMKRHCTILHF